MKAHESRLHCCTRRLYQLVSNLGHKGYVLPAALEEAQRALLAALGLGLVHQRLHSRHHLSTHTTGTQPDTNHEEQLRIRFVPVDR